MGSEIQVVIISSNRLFRESLARILNKRQDVRIIAAMQLQSENCAEIAETHADILLLDSIHDLHTLAKAFREPKLADWIPRFVLVAMHVDPQQFMKAVRCGVLGYVLKEASASEVVNAVRSVAQGEAVCPPSMCKVLFECVENPELRSPIHLRRDGTGLTRREQQLIPLIGQGLTNKEIASHLNLSEKTIKNHVHRILHKLRVQDRLEAVQAFRAKSLNFGEFAM